MNAQVGPESEAWSEFLFQAPQTVVAFSSSIADLVDTIGHRNEFLVAVLQPHDLHGYRLVLPELRVI